MTSSHDGNETLNRALAKWESVKNGAQDVIVDDETLDLLSAHFKDQDTAEADVYFKHTSSPFNPQRVGIRDTYVLNLSEKGRDLLTKTEMVP